MLRDSLDSDHIPTAEVDGCDARAELEENLEEECVFALEAASDTLVRAHLVTGDEFALRRCVRPGSLLRLRWENARGIRVSIAPVIGWEGDPVLQLRPFLGSRGIPRREVRVKTRGSVDLLWSSDDAWHSTRGQFIDVSIRGFRAEFSEPPPEGLTLLASLALPGTPPVVALVTAHRAPDGREWFEFDGIGRRDRALLATFALRPTAKVA